MARAIRVVRDQLDRQETRAFSYRRVRAEFERHGLAPAALARLVELGMLEKHELPGGEVWWRPTGHEVWWRPAG